MRQPRRRAAGIPEMSRRAMRRAKREERRLRRRERRPLRLRRLLSLLSVIGAGVLIGFRGGAASYLLLWATLLPPLYALVWRLTAGRRFRALMRVDAPSALRGERLGCTLILINNSPLPISALAFRLSDGRVRFEETGEQRVSLAPGEVRELRFTPLCVHCGKAELGAVSLRLWDPFALAQRQLCALESAIVEPRTLRLPRLLIAPPEELEQRRSPQMYLGERTPNGELRAYQSGDDVRRVHWKVSVLQGRPMLRAMEPESRNELVLLPDLRASLPTGEAGYLAEDSIREGTLALADWFLRRGIPLRVQPDERRAVTIRMGSELLRLRAMMSGDCFTGERRSDEMMELDLAAGHAVRRYILLTWEFDEALLRRAARCISLGADVTLLYIAADERLPRDGGEGDLREQAVQSVSRLEFHQISARRDVYAVLSGGEGGSR